MLNADTFRPKRFVAMGTTREFASLGVFPLLERSGIWFDQSKCFCPGFAIYKHCCCLITLVAGYYLTAPLSPLFAHLPVYTCSLTLFLTCEPARRLSVASPPLQKKEIVASFRHPELQGVFQENFLRVQPHILLKGRDRQRGIPRRCRSLQRGLWEPVWKPVLRLWSGLIEPHSGEVAGFSMILLPRRQLQLADFLASFPRGRFAAAGRAGTRSSQNEDVSLWFCVALRF